MFGRGICSGTGGSSGGSCVSWNGFAESGSSAGVSCMCDMAVTGWGGIPIGFTRVCVWTGQQEQTHLQLQKYLLLSSLSSFVAMSTHNHNQQQRTMPS